MAVMRGPLPADHFTMLYNEWLRDGRLTYKARGLLAYIASHDPGYQLSTEQMITEQDGRRAVLSALRELEDAGYLVRTQGKDDDGRFTEVDYELTGVRLAAGGKPHRGADQAKEGVSAGQPASTKPHPGPDQPKDPVSAGQTASTKPHSGAVYKKTEEDEEEVPPQQAAPVQNAGTVLADWIDYCQAGEVRLPKQVIGRYAAEIKRLLDEGFAVNHVKRALGAMRDRGVASKPGMLAAFMVQVQEQRPPQQRQEYRTAAEKKQASTQRESLRAQIIDRIRAEEPGKYNLSRYEDARDLGIRVDGILAQLDTQAGNGLSTCHTPSYTGPKRDVIDVVWTEETPREVTAG